MTEMRSSYLVQRLNPPHGGADNPFAFGGGMKNGGLAEGAMELLRPIFSFDYMGAAEYEFGDVPRAFQKIAEYASEGRAALFGIVIPNSEVDTAHLKDWGSRKKVKVPPGESHVYIICHADWCDEVETRVRAWAAKNWRTREDEHDIRDATNLPARLIPQEDSYWDTIGWLEMDNGFLFFTDADAAEKTAALFGVGDDDELD